MGIFLVKTLTALIVDEMDVNLILKVEEENELWMTPINEAKGYRDERPVPLVPNTHVKCIVEEPGLCRMVAKGEKK